MAPDDLGAVVALEREIYPQPWTPGVFEEELSRPNRVYLAAEDGDELVGYAGLMMIDEDAHVTTVAVSPTARKKKLGSRLLLALIEEGLASGCHHLTLEVRVSNHPARDLYQRFGLAPVGLRKNYYVDEDALIMWAIDIDGPEYRDRLQRIREEIDG
jgi:ribosomal-protein-alanine N-acetyltransferase